MAILDLFRLDGQVALITGGGGGLGGAIARAFADVGADVALVGRTRAPLELVQAEVEARGRRCAVIPADVTDPAAAAEIVKATIAQLGKLTILVNNVGGLRRRRGSASDDGTHRTILDDAGRPEPDQRLAPDQGSRAAHDARVA